MEHSIGRKIDDTIVSDGRSVVYALNRGVPFFLSNKEAQVSQDILRLARTVTSSDRASAPAGDDSRKPTQKKSLFALAMTVAVASPVGARRGSRRCPC